jgi:hypothetical protein
MCKSIGLILRFRCCPPFDIVDDGLAAFVETESIQTSGLTIYRVMG